MSILRTQAEALGVCPATVSNYRRALRDAGKRITVVTLRAHRDRQKPGRKPNNERANRIRAMRDQARVDAALAALTLALLRQGYRCVHRLGCLLGGYLRGR